jgi:hypothetical protein
VIQYRKMLKTGKNDKRISKKVSLIAEELKNTKRKCVE